MKEDNPQSPITPQDLPSRLAAWYATEAPKIEAFERLLIQRAEQLRMGTIDEGMFLQVLIESNEPVKVWTKSRDAETGDKDFMEVERTKEGRIRLRSQQVAAWPQITVTVGLSNDGHLIAEDVQAEYVEENALVLPHVVKGDLIRTDVFSNPPVQKQEAGKALIVLLKNVVPLSDERSDIINES